MKTVSRLIVHGEEWLSVVEKKLCAEDEKACWESYLEMMESLALGVESEYCTNIYCKLLLIYFWGGQKAYKIAIGNEG